MLSEKIYDELYELAGSLLAGDHQLKLKVGGFSMFPFLRAGDVITIQKCSVEDVSRGDIIVFRKANKWVAHRLINAESSGSETILITRGDSCKKYDAPVTSESFVGKVISYSRNGKEKIIVNRKKPSSRELHFMRIVFLKIMLFLYKTTHHFSALTQSIKFITQKSRKYFFTNIVIAVFQGIIPFVIIYLVKWIIDSVAAVSAHSAGIDLNETLSTIVILTGAVFLIGAVLGLLGSYYRERLSQTVSDFIYQTIHSKHANLDMSYLEDSDQQDRIHRAIQQASYRPNKLLSETLALVTGLVSWLIIMAVFFQINWVIFLLLLIAVTPGFFVRLHFTGHLYRLNKSNSHREREASYYSRILTAIPFAKEVRLFGLERFFSFRFGAIQNELHGRKNKILHKRLWMDIAAQTFTVILIFLAFAYVIALAVDGVLSTGTVVLFFMVFQRGFAVLKDLFQSVAGLFEDNVFMNDFFDFLNLPSLRKTPAGKVLEPMKKGVSVKNVSFRYPSSRRLALESVSLELPVGKTIAIVGANGSGKTTLVKLLCGFYTADKGQIFFDDTDISLVDAGALRKSITAVFQDFALYHLTAAENIALGNSMKPVQLDEIKKAAENADMDDVIEHLPEGYNTILGNLFKKGEELSIGQWQKIAIAKAFYRNTPFLIMDEPSSALDAETELHLLQNLQNLSKDKTVLIISHRFSSIKWADCIYVMDKGRIIESGDHQALMALKGEYCRMYEIGRELK